MSVQDFIDELGLDLATEQVGENPDLPAFFVPFAINYRLEIIRSDPYRSEGFFISVAEAVYGNIAFEASAFLPLMAAQINDYHTDVTPLEWSRARGWAEPPEGVIEKWDTFAKNETKFMRIFGDDFERFLALDPRRVE